MTENNPLVISLNGGLGNQFFMLFAGISKSIDENRDYLIYLEHNDRHYYFDSIMNHLYNKVINYNNIQIQYNNIYSETSYNYNPIPNNYDLIKGYFQSPKYFSNNYDKLKEIFKIDYYKNIYKINMKSIAIHFRFGDYLKLQHCHRIISFVYYLKAINYLKEKLSDFDEYTFVIFGEKSNNDLIDCYINQLNHNLSKPLNYIKIYDRYPNSNVDYTELFYMSNCDHNIIGNSTFSWFGAYFNDNKNKIVIHPSKTKWFADEVINNYNLNDLFPNNWIEIDY